MRFVPQALAAGAAAVMAERAPPTPLPAVAFVQGRQCAPRAGAGGGEILSPPAAGDRAITGTSGKTLGRRLHRQIWAALGEQAASIGTVGLVTPTREVYGSLTTPDPVALALARRAGRKGVTHLRRSVLARARPASPRRRAGGGRRFRNLSRDHPRLSPDARSLSRGQAALVHRPDRAARRGRDRCRPRAYRRSRRLRDGAGCGSSRSGAAAMASACSTRPSTASRSADGRIRRPRLTRAPAAARRLPGRECAGRGRPRHRHRQRAPTFAALARLKGARAASSWWARTTARRSSSTTPTSPTRSPRRSKRCGPTRRGSRSCSAAAATAIQASAR